MKAFPTEDLTTNLQDLGVGQDLPPMQQSLSLGWDLATDTLTFQVASLFDPLGFAAPVSVRGRSTLRELTTGTCEWDALLPKERLVGWQMWCTSVEDLRGFKVLRVYTSIPLSEAQRKEICVFCDASTMV